jgi:hypothetical protein
MWRRVFPFLIATLVFSIAGAAFHAVPAANAQAQPFYQGKTIRIVVGFTPGDSMIAGPACLPAICRNTSRATQR